MDEKSWLGFGGRVGSGRGIMDVHHFWGWDEGGDAKNASDERSRSKRKEGEATTGVDNHADRRRHSPTHFDGFPFKD